MAHEQKKVSSMAIKTPGKVHEVAKESREGKGANGNEEMTGNETVLLVEDTEGLRRLSKRILESKGYTVIEARDSQDALNITNRHEGPIHLLLTDVVLPDAMNGPELATKMACIRPQTRVLYMSGYTEDSMLSQVVQSVFIQKPFTPKELARKVRAVLDQPHRPAAGPGPTSVKPSLNKVKAV